MLLTLFFFPGDFEMWFRKTLGKLSQLYIESVCFTWKNRVISRCFWNPLFITPQLFVLRCFFFFWGGQKGHHNLERVLQELNFGQQKGRLWQKPQGHGAPLGLCYHGTHTTSMETKIPKDMGLRYGEIRWVPRKPYITKSHVLGDVPKKSPWNRRVFWPTW